MQFLGGFLLLGGSDSQTPPHHNNVFWESLHFGHFKAAQFAIKVQHPFVNLPDLTESTMRAWQQRKDAFMKQRIQTNHCSFSCPLTFMNYKHCLLKSKYSKIWLGGGGGGGNHTEFKSRFNVQCIKLLCNNNVITIAINNGMLNAHAT